MLQWQHLFPTAVVQRGREYYKKNLVRSLIRDGETYYAAVQGTREYQVTVHLRGERIESMECDCPYASEGNRCKHMAATLYEISARQIPGTRSERKAAAGKTGHVRIYPYAEENFPEEGKEREYRYYVPARFTGNLAIYADGTHTVIDPEICEDCHVCQYVCPRNVIKETVVPEYIFAQREALGIREGE